jgi:REP element-mobilizing transposase RayT
MAWRNISDAKHKCEHHLVWWPKRRRVLADAEVRTRVCETFRAIAEELGFGIEELRREITTSTSVSNSCRSTPARGWSTS